MEATGIKILYDFDIKLNGGSITLKPLNEDAQLWIAVAIMKPMGLSRPIDIESVIIPMEDLERTLRRIMNSGYQVNFIK